MSRIEEGEDWLEHYGVKGMKWGVRRSKAALAKAAAKRKEARDPSTPEGAERLRRKVAADTRRTISDADLDKLVSRLEKEKKLKSLVEEDLSAGKAATKVILSDTGKQVMKQVAGGVAISVASVALANKFGDTSDGRVKTTANEFKKAVKVGGKFRDN